MNDVSTVPAMGEVPPSTPLSVVVIATTMAGTRRALIGARQIAGGRDASATLLVPRRSSANGSHVTQKARTLLAEVGLEATVHVCVCRDVGDIVQLMLGRSSLLVIGGRRSALWPTREERLSRRLSGQGYSVVFAEVLDTPPVAARLQGVFRDSWGASEVAAPIVSSETGSISATVTESVDPALVDDSTRPWLLAGIAFVVFLALLTIWAWVTYPADGRFAARPLVAAQQLS